MKRLKSNLIIIVMVIFGITVMYSCDKSETNQPTTSKLIVKTNVIGYGHIENVIVTLVNRPDGNYVEQKITNNKGIAVFDNLQSGKYAVDCEFIIVDKQIDYITISNDFKLEKGNEKIVEITVD